MNQNPSTNAPSHAEAERLACESHPLSKEALTATRGRPKGSTYNEPTVAARRQLQQELSTPVGYEDEMLKNTGSLPQVGIKQEKAEHRLMIYLKSMGLSNVEIGEKLGCHKQTVANVLAQPWAKQRLVKELVDAGKPVVQAMLEAAAVDTVTTMIEIRDDKAAPASARVAVCNALMDRLFGKPVQKVETDVTHRNGGLEKVDEIDKELARLQAEQQLFTGKAQVRPEKDHNGNDAK
jgi:lambda repressor-like predicted transcriptional regulator